MMRSTTLLAAATFVLAACSPDRMAGPDIPAPRLAAATCELANGNEAERGFDDLQYNRCAGIFNGAADGTDGVIDGNVWGDPTYAKDHLVMKWNAAWDKCNVSPTADNCAGAWITNEWNGQAGGSGETWHYKIVWIGAAGAVPEGGYRVWGSYAVVFSHGTAPNEHFWQAHASPNGFGSF